MSVDITDFFMALTKEKKQEILNDLKEKIQKHKSMVFVDFKGLKVKDLTQLRENLKEENNELKVAKKTLIGKAFKDEKINIDQEELTGEVALILGYQDQVSPSRIVHQFAKENKTLSILGGYLEGQFIDNTKVEELAQLPSKEVLLARLVGTMSAPISNFANVLNANLTGLVQVLSQIKK